MAFQIKKSLDDFGDKVTEDEKKEITELADELKKAAEEKNLEAIDEKQKALQEKWTPIVQRMNNSGGGENPLSGFTGTPNA